MSTTLTKTTQDNVEGVVELPDWKKHGFNEDCGDPDTIITRSQTGFNRVPKCRSNLNLFADQTRHEPTGRRHLVYVMKGQHGNIPTTVVTRLTGEKLDITEALSNEVDAYKARPLGRKVQEKHVHVGEYRLSKTAGNLGRK